MVTSAVSIVIKAVRGSDKGIIAVVCSRASSQTAEAQAIWGTNLFRGTMSPDGDNRLLLPLTHESFYN